MLYDEDAAWSRPSSRNSGLPRRRDLGMTHIPEQVRCRLSFVHGMG